MRGGAFPPDTKRALQRGVDQAAQRREKRVIRRPENGHVKIEVGLDEVPPYAVAETLHPRKRLGDAFDHVVGLGLRRQSGGRRLNHLPEHEQVLEELQPRARLQVPGEHIGIEHVPFRLRPHARSDLGPRDDQRLGGQ